MGRASRTLLDLDHVVTRDGEIYRVVGNLNSRTHFLGYNVYSPNADGDRFYQEQKYRKNFLEDENLPDDALDVYKIVPIDDITEHLDPIRAAKAKTESFASTVWHDLYTELVRLFGDDTVGIFGSSMFGLHLTPDGLVRKDIDFVIQGLEHVDALRHQLPRIRRNLGFSDVSRERQLLQHSRYAKVFRNEKNSIQSIIARRWTGLQLSPQVVTTIRFRDPAVPTPSDLVVSSSETTRNIVVSGQVTDAARSNLFPRQFTLMTESGPVEIYLIWWKFSTPVRDGDSVTLCGSLLPNRSQPTARLTNFVDHWLKIDG